MHKKQNLFIAILCLLLTCPIILLGFFNHQQSDDYRFAVFVQDFGFWQAQIEWYLKWSGRWFSNFISSLQPILIHNWSLYKLYPILEILWLFITIRIIILKFLPKSKDSYFPLLFAAGIVCIWLLYNPTLAETLYWITGYNNYIIIIPFTLWLICQYKYISQSTSLKNMLWILLTSFILVGSSEIFMFFMLYWCLIWLSLKIIHKKTNYKDVIIISLTLIFITGTLISPGNLTRAECNIKTNPLTFSRLLYETTSATFSFISYELEMLCLPIFMIICLPIIRQYTHFKIKYIHQFLIIGLFVSFIWICFLLSTYINGTQAPTRYISSLHLICCIAFPFIGSLIYPQKWQKYLLKLNQNKIYHISLIILLIVFLIVPARKPLFFNIEQKSNIIPVCQLLYSGEASRFDKAMNKRYQMIENHKNSDIKLPKIKYPLLINYRDLYTDSNDWYNKSYAQFWHLNSIKIED